MPVGWRILPIGLLPMVLVSCTSLFFVHDPQSGVISAGLLPDFVKSVKCELITFYQLERTRKQEYEKLAKLDPVEAFSRYAYFEINPFLYGTFTLELKVTDSLGVGAGTAIDSKHISDPTHSDTWHAGPTASGQGTYDLIWNFLLRQDAGLAPIGAKVNASGDEADRFACYRGPLNSLEELEQFAAAPSSRAAQFRRIFVNGQKPLAAWLRDIGSTMNANRLGPTDPAERAELAQMYYSFAVQVIAGLDVKYTLLSPQWNPLAAQLTGSLQQNSNLQVYINGPGAPYANSAKAGGATWVKGGPALGSAANPIYVIPGKGDKGSEFIMPDEETPSGDKKKPKRKIAPRAQPDPFNKGTLITPLTVSPPSASQ